MTSVVVLAASLLLAGQVGTAAPPAAAPDAPLDGTNGVVPPVALSQESALWPVGHDQYEATLLVDAIIDVKGNVDVVDVLNCKIKVAGRKKTRKAVHEKHCPAFIASAQKAVSAWKFKPATLDGTPVELWFRVVVEFAPVDPRAR